MTVRNLAWRTILISLCAITSLWGQDSRGSLLGRVTDPTAAAVAGAKVDVLNTNTGVHYSSTTNATGDFLVPYLIPGAYEITIDNPGFKTYRRSGIALQQGQRLTLDVMMELGGTAEIVEVTGEVPLVDTSTASVGQVVEGRQILDLPTKDGNALVLATLVPGVVFTPQNAGYVRPFDTFSPSMMSVNGTRPGSNEFLVDGSPNIQGTEVAYSPAASVLSEFKVQTSTFDPSWGFNTGAAINFTTKSGTNTPHGVIRYNHLNPALNSDKYFRLPQGKPQLRTHHFDTSFNGPVYIPKVYDGHNRTFFTVGFEAGRWFDPTPFYVQSVPTEAMRRGDFSRLLAVSPAYQIYDPLTTRPVGNGLFERDPFPGNIIPADRINPIAARVAELMDPPNQPGEADGTNNRVLGRNMQDDYSNFLARIDHTLTNNQRIFGRFYTTSLERPEYISNNNMVGDTFYRYNRGFVLSHVYAVSPTTVVESRYSFMRFRTGYIPMQQGWDLASLGFSGNFINQLNGLDPRALKLPNFDFANYFAGTPIGGQNSNNNRADMIHEPNVNVTKVVSSHTIQSGVAYRAYLRNGHNLGDSSGQFTFDSTFTRGPLSTSPVAPMGQDFASFLLGIPASGSIPINTSFAVKQSYWALYLKDDWKARPNLTVTLAGCAMSSHRP